jgi:hypothetical protein
VTINLNNYSGSYLSREDQNQELSTEKKLGAEHRGSQESIPVQKYSLEINLSVTYPKSTSVSLETIAEDLNEQFTSLQERTIGKHSLTSMTGYYKEHGMRIMKISDSVGWVLRGSQLVPTSLNTTISV